jgi:hypothetical protein
MVCPKCKEASLYVKISGVKRVEYCSNRGCGYRLKLPDLERVSHENAK